MRATASRTWSNRGGVVRTLLGAACALLLGSLAARASAATVMTDQANYTPGETVVITGSGWEPGETVILVLHEEPMTHADLLLAAVADANGDFSNADFATEAHDAGVTFTLTASGSVSGLSAETTFTDAPCTPSTVCRAAAGECDVAEICDAGGSCPADVKKMAGTACSSDGNPCTLDVCNGMRNDCQHPAGNAGAACESDGNPCTIDQCNGMKKDCQHEAGNAGAACESDDNPCTIDQCDGEHERCQHEEKDCADDNLCTMDRCDRDTGQCEHEEKRCEHEPSPSPSEEPSPSPSASPSPSDNDGCLEFSCNPDTGDCEEKEKDCDDGNACTDDTCTNGMCEHQEKDCKDANVCTDDSCNPTNGQCVHMGNTAPCNDGKACTVNDVCKYKVCQPGKPKDCSDGSECTTDTCTEPKGDCEHKRVVDLSQRANTNQKGSLLVLPKIVVDSAKGVDTIVDMANAGDYDVTVTCYWVDGTPPSATTLGACRGGLNDGQPCTSNADCAAAGKQPAGTCEPAWASADFHFPLTKRQPAFFKASDGLPGPAGHAVTPFPSDPGKGELKCWASDAFGGQIKHNYLKGEALITDATNATSWEYPAYGFQCRLASKNGAPCGDPGTIRLDGCEFDACPGTLELDFFASNDKVGQSTPLGGKLDTDIALLPCDQDLRQEGEPVTTKEKYDIWNENETKFTGLTRCLTCFDHAKLSAIGGALRRSALTTEKGLARIDGVADDTKCCPKELDHTGNLVPQDCSQPTGLLGVEVKEIDRGGRLDRAGEAIHGAGGQVGRIDFDLNEPSEEGR